MQWRVGGGGGWGFGAKGVVSVDLLFSHEDLKLEKITITCIQMQEDTIL